MHHKKMKGYTLIELLIGTGILSLAAIGVYTIAMVANDWRKSSQEVKSLNAVIKEIDNSTLTTGSYTGVTLSSLHNYSTGLNSALPLKEIVAPTAKKLNFVYDGVSSRVCNDFAGKMLQSSNNIGAIINGTEITSKNLNTIASACDSSGAANVVTIVLNKTQDDYTIDNVVASVNITAPPPPEPPLPNIPIPSIPPVINPYTPSGLNPGTYPLVTGGPPTFTPGPGGGGPIVVTPGSPGTPVTPPTWNPPPVVRPPGTPAPPDQLDQDPNPPVVTTETRSGSCPAGYVGSTTETRIRTYYPSTGVVNYTPWIEVSSNCSLIPPGPDFSVGNVISANFDAVANPFFNYPENWDYRYYPSYATNAERAQVIRNANYQQMRNIGSTYTIKEPGWGELRPAIPGFFGWDMSNPQSCTTTYWRKDFSVVPTVLRGGYFVTSTDDYQQILYVIHTCKARALGS